MQETHVPLILITVMGKSFHRESIISLVKGINKARINFREKQYG
jgi:hypothetical protein